jgi:hypothetical protein
MAKNITVDQWPTDPESCLQTALVASLYGVETVLKKIDDDIEFKEIDKKRKPYTVKNTLSLCFTNSISSVLCADPRADDQLACTEDAGVEPVAAVIDTFSGNQKVNKLIKELPSLSHNNNSQTNLLGVETLS